MMEGVVVVEGKDTYHAKTDWEQVRAAAMANQSTGSGTAASFILQHPSQIASV